MASNASCSECHRLSQVVTGKGIFFKQKNKNKTICTAMSADSIGGEVCGGVIKTEESYI